MFFQRKKTNNQLSFINWKKKRKNFKKFLKNNKTKERRLSGIKLRKMMKSIEKQTNFSITTIKP